MKFILKKSLTRKILFFIFLFVILLGIGLFICNQIIVNSTSVQLFTDVSKIKKNKVGLILGTSRILSNGRYNLFFKYRIEAAVELYKAAKIDYLIVSGDNHIDSYNEPEEMKNELIAKGVPDSIIYMDFAGFRTFDSVIRCKEIFGQNEFTIISQKFHNQRAVYIANQFGIRAVGFNAKDVDTYNGFKTIVREYFAKGKVFFDLLVQIKPHFLGKKIVVGTN